MKERLIIKNFGPIKSVDLELGRITILIGEQASGKSTIAKVLAVCRYFSFIVDDSSTVVNNKSNFSNVALRAWGLDGFENSESFISYENTDYSVEIKNVEEQSFGTAENNNEVRKEAYTLFKPHLIGKSGRFKSLLEAYEKLKPVKKSGFGIAADWHIPHSFLTTDVKNVMDNPFYFPTERGLQSIFSIGKRGLENLTDHLYEQFAALNTIAANFKNETVIEPLDLTYKNENSQGYFKKRADSEYFNLSKGASGYKSAIPIVLGVKYYSVFEKRKRTFLIEEPEQNLFPKAQKKLVEFLVSYVNKFDHSLLLTTHSPYILTALENLMYAHKLGNENNGKYREKVKAIIGEIYWIDQKYVNVYYLGGEKEIDLMQRDESLINKDFIDSVSEIINEEFDKLLNIELKLENETTE